MLVSISVTITKESNVKKENIKVIIPTSLFWILVAGVIILVQQTAKSNFERGYNAGFVQAKVLLQK